MTELELLRTENANLKAKLAQAIAALKAVQPYATRWHDRMESFILNLFDGDLPIPPEESKTAFAMYNQYRDQHLCLELLMKEALGK